jgi:hypothetical protein
MSPKHITKLITTDTLRCEQTQILSSILHVSPQQTIRCLTEVILDHRATNKDVDTMNPMLCLTVVVTAAVRLSLSSCGCQTVAVRLWQPAGTA